MTAERIDIEQFFDQQLRQWPAAAARYAALSGVLTRRVEAGGAEWTLQCNPSRAVSTGASTDAASIAARPCFLCRENRPKEQIAIEVGQFELLVNPFPIFRRHFTIAAKDHQPQRIAGNVAEMLRFAEMLEGFTISYNGPRCGASAPDHLHFQAVESTALPIDKAEGGEFGPVGIIRLSGEDRNTLAAATEKAIVRLGGEGEEPMINLLAKRGCVIIIPRRRHRPECYLNSSGEGILFSPASIDMGGVAVLPRLVDFESVSGEKLVAMLSEVSYSPSEIQLL